MFHINEGLDSFEKMQKIIIITDEWTIDNGLMTPTLKIKRVTWRKVPDELRKMV